LTGQAKDGRASGILVDMSAPLPPPRHPDETGEPYRICLVCLGNICRSPMAEVVLTAELAAAGLGDSVTVDSAGPSWAAAGTTARLTGPGRSSRPG